jgi:acyl-CoA thioesterase I
MKKYIAILGLLACARGGTPGDSVNAQASGTVGTSSTQDARRTPTQDVRRTVLFVGTSLTAGYGLEPDSAYPQQIQRMIDSAGLAYDVVNGGVSGETSSGLLARLDWQLRQPFDVIVIETGANDGLRGVPIETMQANIEQTIQKIRVGRPNARIVLVQMEALPNLGRGYTQRFHDVFPAVARKTGVALIPFLLEDVAGRRELNQGDGIHPNYEGERIVARNVWKGLRPLLP